MAVVSSGSQRHSLCSWSHTWYLPHCSYVASSLKKFKSPVSSSLLYGGGPSGGTSVPDVTSGGNSKFLVYIIIMKQSTNQREADQSRGQKRAATLGVSRSLTTVWPNQATTRRQAGYQEQWWGRAQKYPRHVPDHWHCLLRQSSNTTRGR